MGCCFSPNGLFIVSVSDELKVWESHSGRCVRTEECSERCCAFSGDGSKLVTSEYKDAIVWDTTLV